MKASRGVLLVALALLALAAIRDVGRLGEALPWHQLYDFGDFYCAGAALDAGSDPYRYEPLHRCEHAVNLSPSYRADPRRVIPAPLPPYDFPPFMLLAHLNFAGARLIGALAIVIAVAASVVGLALLAIPLDVAALALLFPAGYVLLNAGQVVPFALLALVFCGVALARGHNRLAGILAALSLIEPHLGLPICAALLCWAPRSRLALCTTALILTAVAGVLVGAPGMIEYVTRVLPGQAAAETGYAYQYSLTYLLHAVGVPPSAAIVLGELSYAAMLLAGLWLGRRASQAFERPELLAYLPAACSIVAGPYVHMVDLVFAMPASLVLATTLHGRPKDAAVVGVSLLAVPWIPVWIAKRLFLATMFVVAALLLRLGARLPLAIGTFVAIAAAIYLLELAPPAPLVATTAGLFAAGDLAQQAWRQYVEQLPNASTAWLMVKVPTWLALLTTLGATLAGLRAPATAAGR